MANKKFSEFTLKTDSANVDFVVGYDGTDNVRIAPSNLSSGGASSLNGLTDCSVTSEFSQFIGNVPSGVTSGNAFYNTCLGHNALESLTGGAYNTVIGFEAGDAITSNNKNTVFGAQAFSSSNSANVTAIGYAAGNAASGNDAVYVGYQAGKANTADRTIAIGYQAGYSQTSGGSNTVIGERAAYSNTTGENNTSVGDQTAYSSTGSKNTSVGKGAFGGGFGHSGSDNVAIGYLANQQPSGASNYNVAIGSEALRSSGTRSNNVAVGYKAGTSITTGGGNTLVGYLAGEDLVSGVNNVAIGQEALKSETNHGRNVAVGYGVLQTQNAGAHAYNVGIGYGAGGSVNTGKQNTFLGGKTGETLTTGDNNTIIGYNSSPSAVDVDNEFTLGNSSITALRCAVTSITSLSDARDKSEIKDLEYGLNFIDALQPREFVWNNRPETTKEIDEDGNETEVEFYSANKGKKDFGFIAQEVQALDDDTLRLVYDENPEKLELSYGKLVPVLVKAIQDLSAKVTALENA